MLHHHVAQKHHSSDTDLGQAVVCQSVAGLCCSDSLSVSTAPRGHHLASGHLVHVPLNVLPGAVDPADWHMAIALMDSAIV